MTIETNYNLGQEVYFMYDNKVQSAKIVEVIITITDLNAQYCIDHTKCEYKLDFRAKERANLMVKEEKELFATREDLLKSL